MKEPLQMLPNNKTIINPQFVKILLAPLIHLSSPPAVNFGPQKSLILTPFLFSSASDMNTPDIHTSTPSLSLSLS